MKNNKLMLAVFGSVLAFTVAVAAADAPKLTFTFVTTNVPGALQTFPNDINNANVIVGQYEDSQGFYHGYILKGKHWKTLDDPNGTSTYANGINYNGPIMVVGYYFNSSNEETGFLYKDGTFTDIIPPGAVVSAAYGINDNGWIVGKYND